MYASDESPEREANESPKEEQGAAAESQQLEEQAAKAQSYLANWQKAEADLVNLRRRTEQEKAELAAYANGTFVAALLPVLDDMERAFKGLEESGESGTWVEGLKHVHRKLFSTLEAQGLTAIPTEKQRFDPALHEAIMHEDGEEGQVLGELQKGYRYKGKVVRPALVKVGNGNKARRGAG